MNLGLAARLKNGGIDISHATEVKGERQDPLAGIAQN